MSKTYFERKSIVYWLKIDRCHTMSLERKTNAAHYNTRTPKVALVARALVRMLCITPWITKLRTSLKPPARSSHPHTWPERPPTLHATTTGLGLSCWEKGCSNTQILLNVPRERDTHTHTQHSCNTSRHMHKNADAKAHAVETSRQIEIEQRRGVVTLSQWFEVNYGLMFNHQEDFLKGKSNCHVKKA